MAETFTPELVFGQYTYGTLADPAEQQLYKTIRVGPTFDPASVFGGADQGAVYDFTSAANLFQSTDTSVPVTATGQPIGRVNDLSGKNNHATQVGTARPTFQGYGDFDGVDDTIVSAAVNLSASDKMTLVISLRATAAGSGLPFQTGGGAGSFGLEVNAGNYTRGVLTGDTAQPVVDITGPTLGVNAVISSVLDLAGATATDEIKMYLDGAFPAQSVIVVGPAGGGNLLGTAFLRVSSAGASVLFFTGRVFKVLMINRLLSESERVSAQTWALTGV